MFPTPAWWIIIRVANRPQTHGPWANSHVINRRCTNSLIEWVKPRFDPGAPKNRPKIIIIRTSPSNYFFRKICLDLVLVTARQNSIVFTAYLTVSNSDSFVKCTGKLYIVSVPNFLISFSFSTYHLYSTIYLVQQKKKERKFMERKWGHLVVFFYLVNEKNRDKVKKKKISFRSSEEN